MAPTIESLLRNLNHGPEVKAVRCVSNHVITLPELAD